MSRRRSLPPSGPSLLNKKSRMDRLKKKVIEYKSAEKIIGTERSVLETFNKHGIACSWSGETVENDNDEYDALLDEDDRDYFINFIWDFDWTILKAQGVESLTGYLIIKPKFSDHFSERKIDIFWKEGKQKVELTVETDYDCDPASFELHLTAHYSEIKEISYEEMFAASGKTDAVLVVEGKKLHVNKAFLSIHSDFFTALFSSNFKEGNLTEIPIEDITYEDFGLLMSTVYPKQMFPNDETAEKLLKLADRFLMPAVTRQVERHLLETSELDNEKLLFIADAYKLPKLLEATILMMDLLEEVKHLQESPEYSKLSKEAKSSLFDHVMQII